MLGLSVATSTGTARHEFPDQDVVVLGGDPTCDVVLGGLGVLPEHARLERTGDGVRVIAVDLERPLMLNGAPVMDALVRQGDRLEIAEVAITVAAVGLRRRSRLASLGAFADVGAEVGADLVRELGAGSRSAAGSNGKAAPRRRLLLDLDEDDLGIDEVPDPLRSARVLRRVLDATRRLGRAAHEEEVLDAFLDAAVSISGADRAYLLARSAEGALQRLRARDSSGAPVVGDAPLAESVAHDLLQRGGSIVVEDHADEDPRAGVRSVLCASFPGSAPHVLYLDSLHEPGLFRREDGEVFATFAQQAGVALDRARLLSDNQRQRDELSRAGERSDRLNSRLVELLERRTALLEQARADLARVDEEFSHRYPEIVGRGPATLALLRQVDRVAETNVPVLFEGDSGTGKELMARALHASSSRTDAPFVAENCAALPDTLLENELFGHERGAFTGADAPAMGLFERADTGTLFLDEVGDMSASLQTRLLRVLQEREVRRVGGTVVRKVDVRIVTATNRDLAAMVADGRFRQDLYYRLAVVRIRVPPLRERREDVPDLVRHFLTRFGERDRPRECTDAALDALARHPWPGNIRQLENEIRRAVALCRGVIDVEQLSEDVRLGRPVVPEVLRDPVAHLAGRDLKALVEELEVRVVSAALEQAKGNITHTAAALGLSRLGLRKKMQRYGLTKG